jgi:hypothetical protein
MPTPTVQPARLLKQTSGIPVQAQVAQPGHYDQAVSAALSIQER